MDDDEEAVEHDPELDAEGEDEEKRWIERPEQSISASASGT